MKKDNDSKWFFWVLGIVFIVLKLTGYIDWSWWWVLSPFWGLSAIVLIMYLVGILYVASRRRKRR